MTNKNKKWTINLRQEKPNQNAEPFELAQIARHSRCTWRPWQSVSFRAMGLPVHGWLSREPVTCQAEGRTNRVHWHWRFCCASRAPSGKMVQKALRRAANGRVRRCPWTSRGLIWHVPKQKSPPLKAGSASDVVISMNTL